MNAPTRSRVSDAEYALEQAQSSLNALGLTLEGLVNVTDTDKRGAYLEGAARYVGEVRRWLALARKSVATSDDGPAVVEAAQHISAAALAAEGLSSVSDERRAAYFESTKHNAREARRLLTAAQESEAAE